VNNTRTIALLIRHAQTDAVGAWLAGQAVDVSLNQCGRAQAERLRARLSALDLSAIYSSPLQRAIETAGPLARAPLDFVHRVQISPASVTAVALYADSATLLYVNERDPLSPADTA